MISEAVVNFEYCPMKLDECVAVELSGEHILPDYMPAISRVITCTATAAPPVRYMGADNIEYAAGVRYRLLYEDSEGGVWCALLVGEYSHIISLDREGLELSAESTLIGGCACAYAENIAVRVTAPRRVTVRGRVRLCADAFDCELSEFHLRGNSPEGERGTHIRVLEGEADCGRFAFGRGDAIELSESVDGAELGIYGEGAVRVVCSRGEVLISQTQYSAGEVICRGEVLVCILYVKDGEGERVRRYSRRIPFEGAVPLEGNALDGARIVGTRAYGCVSAVSATVEDGSLLIEAQLILCAEACGCRSLVYPKDLYSKRGECELATRAIELRVPLSLLNANITVSASESVLSLGLDEAARPCDASVISFSELSGSLGDDGVLVIEGKARALIVCDDGVELSSAELLIPFKYSTSLQLPTLDGAIEVSVIPASPECKLRCDSEKITVDCELAFAVRICKKLEIKYVCEANFTGCSAESSGGASITVCYPSAEDTLWSIAKRYKLDALSIALGNELDVEAEADSRESLGESKFLIL